MTDYQFQDPAEANPLRPLLRHAHGLGLAQAFEALNAQSLAWSERRQIWRVLEGGAWVEDDDRAIHDAAREFVRLLELAACEMPEEGRPAWMKAVKALREHGNRNTLIQDAKTGLSRPESRYDVEPFMLNGPESAVLDLTDGKIKPRPLTSFFTKRTRARLRLDARSEKFDSLLDQVQPDAEMRSYVQRAFGAGLSGLGGERLIFVLWGPAGSGKSTITSIMSNALGSYAAVMRHDALALRTYGNSGHTSELMPLVGARAAFIHEIPESMALNAAMLKTIVGGEEFSVSEKGKPHFTTRFVAKLYLVSNHPITLPATDDAVWARIQMLPFTAPIANPNRDAIRTLAEDPEVLDAALAWALRGWNDFREGGLRVPKMAQIAEEEQRARNSPISEWLEACVVREAGAEMPSEQAFRSCREWLFAAGRVQGFDTRRFTAEMQAAGFTKTKTRDGAMWRGGRLTPAGQNAP